MRVKHRWEAMGASTFGNVHFSKREPGERKIVEMLPTAVVVASDHRLWLQWRPFIFFYFFLSIHSRPLCSDGANKKIPVIISYSLCQMLLGACRGRWAALVCVALFAVYSRATITATYCGNYHAYLYQQQTNND